MEPDIVYNMEPDIPLPSPIPPPSAPSAPVELPREFSSDSSFRIPATNISSNDGELTEEQISTMSSLGFTRGLSASIARNNTIFPLRYWIVDNSGSMANTDGSRYCETKKGARSGLKVVSCTRWKEIQETVEFHGMFFSHGSISLPMSLFHYFIYFLLLINFFPL